MLVLCCPLSSFIPNLCKYSTLYTAFILFCMRPWFSESRASYRMAFLYKILLFFPRYLLKLCIIDLFSVWRCFDPRWYRKRGAIVFSCGTVYRTLFSILEISVFCSVPNSVSSWAFVRPQIKNRERGRLQIFKPASTLFKFKFHEHDLGFWLFKF